MEMLQEERAIREEGYTSRLRPPTRMSWEARFLAGEDVSKHGDCTHDDCIEWPSPSDDITGSGWLVVSGIGSAGAKSDWLQKHAGAAAEEVLNFCNTHNIVNVLRSAVSLAKECFWSSDLRLEKEADPETGETQIVIALSIRNRSREEVLAAYRNFREKSIQIVPWPQSSWIRLSYDLS